MIRLACLPFGEVAIRRHFPLAVTFMLWLAPAAYAENTTELRWVRGVVISNAAGSVLLQMGGDRRIAIACDGRCAAATPGAIVELHYTDRNDEIRGELLFTDPRSAGELLKRPGRSVRGIVLRTKTSSVQLQVGSKQRTYGVEKAAALIEAGQPQPAAIGRAEVITRLSAGDLILLKYEEHDASIMVGDITLPGSELRAVEVRRLQ